MKKTLRQRMFPLIVATATIAVLAAGSLQAAPFARVARTSGWPQFSDIRCGCGAATAFCGMRDANLAGAPFTGKDASWWLVYDKDALFVVFTTAIKPQGERYLARATANDDPAILEDGDHLLIQVALDPKVGEAGAPFLRLAVNPNGAVWASTIEALPGQNHGLDTSKIMVINHVGGGHQAGLWWKVRVRIPLELLGVKSLDGQTAKVHLAWVTKPLYLSWGGVKADDWARMPEVLFDPVPRAAFDLNGSYPYLLGTDGRINLISSGTVLPAGTADKALDYRLVMVNEAGGQVTWEKKWEGSGIAGNSVKFAGGERVAGVAAEGNVLSVKAVTTLDGQEQTVFSNSLPYQPKQAAVEAALKEWAALRAVEVKAAANFDRIYDPYSDRLDVVVSTALNPQLYAGAELDKARRIIAADRIRVAVADAKGARIAEGEGAVTNGTGHALLQLPKPLPEGDYRIAAELLQGGEAADQADMPFTRQRFDWEKNAIGRERVIIPPWTEVKLPGYRPSFLEKLSGVGTVAHDRLAIWGREYRLQNNGLPAAMISQGEDVLGGPMRLDGVIDGKPVSAKGDKPPRVTLIPGGKFPADFAKYELATNACPVAGKDFKLEKTDGYAAEIAAESRLGAIAVSVKSRLDYDGLYRITLTLTPRQSTTVGSLTLTVPVAKTSDLYRFSRANDMNCCGRIPDGDGPLLGSSQLPPHPNLAGTFVPVVFAGRYDHGLFWLAETDRGWSVDDKDDCVRLVRRQGELALEFRFIARPTTLDRPRTIEFAFMATPSRPKALGYRQAFWEGKRSHDTAGDRFYGGGYNGFQLYTPEDYEGLRKFIYESDGTAPHYYDKKDEPPGYKPRYVLRNAMVKQGYPVTLYGCSWYANAGMREYPTFGSAWTHTSSLAGGYKECKNFANWGHTVKWSTPEQQTTVRTFMSDSFVDCWLWHMVRIGQYSGVNGCFFDCFEPLPRGRESTVKTDIDGVAYRREDGKIQPFACPLRYHERTRRYATALWLVGRPPSLLNSNNPDNCYGPTWYVEGPMFHRKRGENLIAKGVTPDVVAAYTASCAGMGMCASDVVVPTGEKLSDRDEQCFAVTCAYGILHDLYWTGSPWWASRTWKAVDEAVKALSIGDPRVRHLRYWNVEDAKLARPSDPRVLAGGFVHPERTSALIAVLNPTEDALETDLRFNDGLLGRPVKAVTDLMTGAAVSTGGQAALKLGRHETRFLVLSSAAAQKKDN